MSNTIPYLILGPTETDRGKEIALSEIQTRINQILDQIDEGGLVGPHHITHELGGDDEVHIDWTQVVSGLPDTLAGYGITDAYTKAEVDTIIDSLTFADIDGQLNYAQLPTGGGTWANGGDLTLTGGALFVGSPVGTTAGALWVEQTAVAGERAATFSTFSNSTSSVGNVFFIRRITTGDMVDGFGSRFAFQIRDNAGVDNEIARLAVERAGADNSGKMQFVPMNAGAAAPALTLWPSKDIVVSATAKLGFDGTTQGVLGDTYLTESAANTLDFVVGGTNPLVRLSDRLLVGTTSTTGSTAGGIHATGTCAFDGSATVGVQLNVGSNVVVGSNTLATTLVLSLNAADGQTKSIRYLSAGVNRWLLDSSGAESGSDVGSDFIITAFSDAGANLGTAFRINRAAGGAITLARPTTVTGNLTVGGNAVSNPAILVNGAAGTSRMVRFNSAGVLRWTIFGANSTSEGGSDAGSDFAITAYTDAGVAIDNPMAIARAAGGAVTFSRGKVTVGASALSGPVLTINGAAGSDRLIHFLSGGSLRWRMRANSTAESGSNAGSNFLLEALTDAGGLIDSPISIVRASGGAISLTRDLVLAATTKLRFDGSASGDTYLTESSANVMQLTAGGVDMLRVRATDVTVGNTTFASNINVFLDAVSGVSKGLTFRTAGSTRWQVVSNTTAESGSDAGSVFQILAYNDSGVFIDTPFQIPRAAGQTITLGRSLTISAATMTGTDQRGIRCQPTFNSAATSLGVGLSVNTALAAAAFTMTQMRAINVANMGLGAGSAVTTQYGLFIADLSGATNNFAISTGAGLVNFGDDVLLASAKKLRFDGSGTGDTYRYESAANIIDDYAGGKNVLRLDGSTALSDGDTSILVNRKAGGAESLQRLKWKDFSSLVAGDKVAILAA